MSKFCYNCGSELNDIAVYCEICGRKQPVIEDTVAELEEMQELSQDLSQEVPQEVPQEEQPPQASQMSQVQKKKKPTYFWVGIGGGVIAVLLLLVLTILFTGAPYARAVADYFDLNFQGNAQKIKYMAPEAFWDYLEDLNGLTPEDAIDSFIEDEIYEVRMDLLEEEFGRSLEISYEIVDEKELSKKKLDNLQDALKDNYDIPTRTVTKAYALELEVTFDGRKDTDTKEYDIIAVEIDGNWYIVFERGTFAFYDLF